MPQFEMPLGNDGRVFDKLPAFVQGYIEAMFWTECNPDSGELEHATFSDLSLEALATIEADCNAFQQKAASLLEAAYQRGYDEAQAGHDFWLTRNGHGCGFWDMLSEMCRYSEVYIYRGDDGLVYTG